MTNQEVIDKVKKLLALGESDNENEAKSALLMAQKLMAKYDINVEVAGEETIAYSKEVCQHRYDAAYRKPLGRLIADNFRCEMYLCGGHITFFGRENDARIAKEAFEYAYEFAMREGNKLENKAYAEYGSARGVHSSYTQGFIAGLKEAFAVQCTALMIVTPQDVKDEYAEMSKGWGHARGGFRGAGANFDSSAYNAGKTDGRTVMNGRRVEG